MLKKHYCDERSEIIKTKKNKNKLSIGLDTIVVEIETNRRTKIDDCKITSPITGKVVGELKLRMKNGKQNGYRLNICLPKFVRETNLYPLSEFDSDGLGLISSYMEALFGKDYPKITVSTAECNSTIEIENRVIDPMLNMIGHMMLADGKKLFLCVRGKKTGKRYKHVGSIQSGQQVESIKSHLLSNDRFSFKVYNKGLEQGLEKRGALRVEFLYVRNGLDFAGAGKTLKEFLTPESIHKVISVYRRDYDRYFIQRYWNNANHPFYRDCISVIYNDLIRLGGKPLTVAIMNRNLCEFDFALFKAACHKYYEKPNSENKAINRVKKSGEIEINEGIIDCFVQFSRNIVGR